MNTLHFLLNVWMLWVTVLLWKHDTRQLDIINMRILIAKQTVKWPSVAIRCSITEFISLWTKKLFILIATQWIKRRLYIFSFIFLNTLWDFYYHHHSQIKIYVCYQAHLCKFFPNWIQYSILKYQFPKTVTVSIFTLNNAK